MHTSWPIVRISGIEIRVDSSWIFIFGLITWALAGHYLPGQFLYWPRWQYWLVGAITSLLVFSSVLAHELTHSFVASSLGEEVRSITLFMFGGVAPITAKPEPPSKEFLISIVGPISSVALALFFLGIWSKTRGMNEPVAASAWYVCMINFLVAILNLTPGFPLDGGGILRAILRKTIGDIKRATRIASVIGQIVPFLLVFYGIWQMSAGLFFNGLWIALIGWFIHSAAVRGYGQVVIQQRLNDVKAKNLMHPSFDTVHGSLSVRQLLEDHILKRGERAFLVTEGGKLAGIVCLEDVKAVRPKRRTTTKVRNIMTPKDALVTVSPDDGGSQVLAKLASSKIHQVPVLEGGQIKGIICRGDILEYLRLR